MFFIFAPLLPGVLAESSNAILGSPSVFCDDDAVTVAIQTMKPFRGKLFVKGVHADPLCMRNYINGGPPGRGPEDDEGIGAEWGQPTKNVPDWWKSKKGFDWREPGSEAQKSCPPCNCRRKRETHGMAELSVRLGTCAMERTRISDPPGVRVSFVVVVSFHENFITKLDRAYRVQCAYTESNRVLSAEVDVGMQAASNISSVVSPSACEYSISRPDGSAVSRVRVGDIVVHSWRCSSPVAGNLYALLVHNCTVEDEKGTRTTVLDERGCSTDEWVLPTPSYGPDLSASLSSYVFKYPDHQSVDFRCSLSLCLRQNGECDSVTPPKCHNGRHKRSPQSLPSWQIASGRVYVGDVDDSPSPSGMSPDAFPPPTVRSTGWCLSTVEFGLLVCVSTMLSTVSFVWLLLFLRSPFR